VEGNFRPPNVKTKSVVLCELQGFLKNSLGQSKVKVGLSTISSEIEKFKNKGKSLRQSKVLV
jgi:hypothetical protein